MRWASLGQAPASGGRAWPYEEGCAAWILVSCSVKAQRPTSLRGAGPASPGSRSLQWEAQGSQAGAGFLCQVQVKCMGREDTGGYRYFLRGERRLQGSTTSTQPAHPASQGRLPHFCTRAARRKPTRSERGCVSLGTSEHYLCLQRLSSGVEAATTPY